MRKSVKLIAVFAAVALVLTGCTKKSDKPNASNIKVGMAYDTGGKGDGSFNDAAYAGLSKAKADLGVQIKEVEAGQNATDASREELLRLLAKNGYNPVIAVGFLYSTAVGNVAKDYPNTNFAIVDSVVDGKNIASLVFKAEQSSYLVGVIAAKASKTGHIGFIGGMEIPLIKAFEVGYDQGAKSVNPDIMIESKYMGPAGDNTAWNVPEKAKTATEGMIAKGVDVAYAAAGGSGLGMFQAIKAAGGPAKDLWAIGVDSDQYTMPSLADVKDVILTSALKRVDVSVYDVIKGVVDNMPLTGVQSFDLARDGVGYATSNPAVDPYKDAAEAAKKDIIDGKIVVSDK